MDATIDCFGRDKFNEYRDDMGGVGSFNRENRTIYVGHIHLGPDMEVCLNQSSRQVRMIPNSSVFIVFVAGRK